MTHKERAGRFFEKYAPEFAEDQFAVDMLANEFEQVALEQRARIISELQEKEEK